MENKKPDIFIHLTIILSAPRGVTKTAGAKMYATKFAISPTITSFQKHHNSKPE